MQGVLRAHSPPRPILDRFWIDFVANNGPRIDPKCSKICEKSIPKSISNGTSIFYGFGIRFWRNFDAKMNPKRCQNRISKEHELWDSEYAKSLKNHWFFFNILKVRLRDCLYEKLTKIDQQTNSKADPDRWYMCDRFWIDFDVQNAFKIGPRCMKNDSIWKSSWGSLQILKIIEKP